MRLWSLLVIIVLVGLLPACTPPDPAVPTTAEISAATQTVDAMLATIVSQAMATPSATPVPPTPTTIPSPTPAPSKIPGSPDVQVLDKLPQYRIDVEFNYAERYGKVVEEITYTNRSGDAMPNLRLMVELFAYKDLFTLTGLWWQDGQEIKNAVWENIQVNIPLTDPLMPGESLGLKLAYEFQLPSQSQVAGDRPIPLGYTSRQANLVDWYPFIPPYRSGKGWLAHPPSYYGEHLVYDIADFEVNLRIIDERDDLVVAASAPVVKDGQWLRYRHQGARGFTMSIGHEYVAETTQVGKVAVTSYYFPLNAVAGKQALKTTAEALELYQELFGPYPHESLAVVEADFFDGMEYDGLYFLSRAFYNTHTVGTMEDYLVAIAAHETSHQWWYGIVANDQANEPWLDEALSTYCERLYYERYSPKSLDWWWYYRINYYRPQGWVDTSVYNPQGTLQTYQDYRNAVYLNGARFMEDLRVLMGDEAFFAFLKHYATQFAGQVVLSDDFFALLSQHTQADLTPLLQKYFSTRQ